MLDKIIKESNSPQYIESASLQVLSLIIKDNREAHVDFKISYNTIDHPFRNVTFTIVADTCIKIRNIVPEYLMPYINIQRFSGLEHPLLWNHNERYTLEYCVEGIILVVDSFIIEYQNLVEKYEKRWLSSLLSKDSILSRAIFSADSNNLNKKNSVWMTVYPVYKKEFENLCAKYNLLFKCFKSTITGETFTNHQVLMFDSILEKYNSYNHGQPFIIAKQFYVENYKVSSG